jgi:hypothetical protein
VLHKLIAPSQYRLFIGQPSLPLKFAKQNWLRLSMSFHSLNIYLKTGRFLAITPPSAETRENSRCRQIHQVLMIVGLVLKPVGLMYFYSDNSSKFNFVKLAVCILAGWLRRAYSCRIIVEAAKVRSWRRLIEGLKETSYLVQDEDVHTRKVLFKFLCLQIIFWTCCIYRNWFSVSVLGVIYLKLYSVEIFETYLQFFYTLYINTLLEMIRKRYEGLRRRYEHRQNLTHLVQMCRFACFAEESSRRLQRQLRLFPRSFDLLHYPGDPRLFGFQFAKGRIHQ